MLHLSSHTGLTQVRPGHIPWQKESDRGAYITKVHRIQADTDKSSRTLHWRHTHASK